MAWGSRPRTNTIAYVPSHTIPVPRLTIAAVKIFQHAPPSPRLHISGTTTPSLHLAHPENRLYQLPHPASPRPSLKPDTDPHSRLRRSGPTPFPASPAHCADLHRALAPPGHLPGHHLRNRTPPRFRIRARHAASAPALRTVGGIGAGREGRPIRERDRKRS